jgi:hypothetical protein
VNWYQTVFEVIDMRSFSNLWFWIVLAVVWSSASHWVLGVPYDTVLRAKNKGGQPEIDMRDMVRINVNRLLYVRDVSGLWMLGGGCFLLSTLAGLGFYYDLEFAQAVFLLMFPMSIVGLMSLFTASYIRAEGYVSDKLYAYLWRHRFATQLIGIVSIFVTSMWGMYKNLHLSSIN